MKIAQLLPRVSKSELFAKHTCKFVPKAPGCYALTSSDDTVLYVGLASDLSRRMGQHLDSSEKTNPTDSGRAVKFYWLETLDINRVERSWMNAHVHFEGRYPVLNKVFSPT